MQPMATTPDTLAVTAWRVRHEEVAAAVPGMCLDQTGVTGPMPAAARQLARSGARRVRLTGPVDARCRSGVPALLLVRELTRLGVAVDWELVLDPLLQDWRELSHLYPPRDLHGTPDGPAGLARWRDEFFLGKLLIRRGPDFIQVRDRRWSRLRSLTLTAPELITLVLALLEDAVPVEPVAALASGLEDIRVAQCIGDLLWMPAYRVWRWPMPAEFV